MRIVTKGNPPKGFEGTWECKTCGQKWEMDSTDKAPDRENGAVLEGTTPDFVMACGNCKSVVLRAFRREW